MRLDRFLSNLKYGTRSEMTKAIKDGLVKVNDAIILNSHYQVNLEVDQIYFNNDLVIYRKIVNLAIYKPKGYLSANKDNLHPVVLSLLKYPYTRFDFKIAGRLDLDSEGLLILTTSGTLVNEITNPKKQVEKTYLVKTKDLNIDYLKLLEGVTIKDANQNDFFAIAKDIKKINEDTYEIIITEGKFHQVKRMFLAINTTVISLKRIKIGKLELGNLKEGEYQEFDASEII